MLQGLRNQDEDIFCSVSTVKLKVGIAYLYLEFC